jgi:hypothetical protein
LICRSFMRRRIRTSVIIEINIGTPKNSNKM